MRVLVLVLVLFVACASACTGREAAGGVPAPDAVVPDSAGAPDATLSPDGPPDALPIAEPDAALRSTPAPAPVEDWTRDLLSTALTLDLTSLEATAIIELAPSSSQGASFEVADLEILTIEDEEGPLRFRTDRPYQLDVGVPPDRAARLMIRYQFRPQRLFNGWMPHYGVTFLWPYYCSNLFPCRSSPAEGQRYSLAVTGVPPGQVAVYPTSIPADAPAYMPAVAVGDFTLVDLGETAAGTRVRVWHLPGEAEAARAGTGALREVFDFLERTYGPYAFGDEVGTVSADWVEDPTSGMEHHPYWHVGREDLDDPEVNAHEAAHGWFGNGVRIACWEDFVLSEGTTSYISARALASAGVDVWPDFECLLAWDCDPINDTNTLALPDETCDAIDIDVDPLWSTVPYMKGAFFYRDVAAVLGVDALDAAIGAFYRTHVGGAARMQAMLDHLGAAAGPRAAEVEALAHKWLRRVACPDEVAALCPSG